MRRGPLEQAGGTIVIAPGETKALIVSAGNVNRIVTPFAQPDIVTTSPDQFEVRQNVVYAAPAMGEPVTLYLTEQGDEATAISLILMPRLNVASREFRLELAGTAGRQRLTGSVKQASDWERDQPFEATLSDLMARLAAGGVPQGYDLATSGEHRRRPALRRPQPVPGRLRPRPAPHRRPARGLGRRGDQQRRQPGRVRRDRLRHHQRGGRGRLVAEPAPAGGRRRPRSMSCAGSRRRRNAACRGPA